MDSPLLVTKLRAPPQTHHHLPRPRLSDLLERGIGEDGYKLLLLAAPAGYGKTTLLAQWAHATRARVAWFTVEAEDNDPDRFFRSLFAAWDQVQPGVRESPLGLLLGSMEPDRDAVLTAFINRGSACSEPTVFVLDDMHLISEPVLHDALTFLIDHLPPTLHLVLAGRAEPPLPLARYRARHELLELRAEDLQFQGEETAAFLRGQSRLDLGEDEIASLHAQLEGWVAGLQLVSLTLRGRPAAGPLTIGGRHRFIADYLSEDVLAHLPDETRRFLLQTSILDELCGSLADAVTGAAHGQEMLESLERENLFLTPLDDRREWFRYHRLFASYLQTELLQRHPDEIAALHRRAARWYLAHDLPDQAFRHAVAGNDPDLVITIIDRYESLMLHGGELRILQAWLDALPETWYAAFPLLGLARAGVLAFTGALDACVRCVDDVEQRLAPTASADTRWQQARVIAFRCFIACFQNDLERAEMFAAQALRDLPREHPDRGDVYHALGETYGRHGRWRQAREHYLKALAVSRTPTLTLRAAHVFGALADLDLRQGRLRDADANWRKALAAAQEPANWGRLPLPVIGWIDLRLGEILYQRNALDDAWDHLSRGLGRAELGGDARSLIAGYLMACRVTLTQGDVETAAEYLERARPLVEPAAFPDWTSRFERCQLELWLAQNRLRAVADWTDAMFQDDSIASRPESETAQVALVRGLLVKGDQPSREHALARVQSLIHVSEREGRVGVQIEALALQALAQWHGGDEASALISLERALRLAEPEGYVRLFADLGLPMARLLREAQSRAVMPDYTRHLLGACLPDAAPDESRAALLREPLSEREQDVLSLLAAGLTNREIAERLFISTETVKKHTGSIYGKLAVANRTEAAAKAHALELLN